MTCLFPIAPLRPPERRAMENYRNSVVSTASVKRSQIWTPSAAAWFSHTFAPLRLRTEVINGRSLDSDRCAPSRTSSRERDNESRREAFVPARRQDCRNGKEPGSRERARPAGRPDRREPINVRGYWCGGSTVLDSVKRNFTTQSLGQRLICFLSLPLSSSLFNA